MSYTCSFFLIQKWKKKFTLSSLLPANNIYLANQPPSLTLFMSDLNSPSCHFYLESVSLILWHILWVFYEILIHKPINCRWHHIIHSIHYWRNTWNKLELRLLQTDGVRPLHWAWLIHMILILIQLAYPTVKPSQQPT